MKDVFVDNNVAKNFCNPLDPEYKAFVGWLLTEGALVVTTRILVEYIRSTGNSTSATNIAAIVDALQRSGRLNRISANALRGFAMAERIRRRLRSNTEDHEHIKAVLLSVRKFAISHDDRFRFDLNNYPAYRALAVERPEQLPYAS
jgi:hypothetical protein